MILWIKDSGRAQLHVVLRSLIQLVDGLIWRVQGSSIQVAVVAGRLGSAGNVYQRAFLWTLQHSGLRVMRCLVWWPRAPRVSKETGSESCQFLKTWTPKLTWHHFIGHNRHSACPNSREGAIRFSSQWGKG